MFDGIDKIPWSKLSTAHGTAEHVPGSLRLLLSNDIETARKAYGQLDNWVVLQSDLYESAVYLPRFLIEALDYCPSSANKVLILDLLFELANGYAPPDLKLADRLATSFTSGLPMFDTRIKYPNLPLGLTV